MARLLIASIGASALLLAGPASSALVVRLEIVPTRPRVGKSLTFVLRTYAPLAAPERPCGFRLRPWRVRYPFRVEALNPRGKVLRIAVWQGRSNRYVGRLRPRLAGVWKIKVTNFGPRYNSCSGGLLRFRVRR